MPPHVRFSGRAALLAGVACASLTTAAWAKDKPATPAGAKTITDFIATYAGKGASSPPALVVTPEGSEYSVAFDIGTISGVIGGAEFGYAPAVLKFKVFEQDEGAWRIEQTELPPIVGRQTQNGQTIDSIVTMSGVHFVWVIDPAISWVRSSQGGWEKTSLRQKGPGLDAVGETGPVKVDSTSKVSAEGVESTDGRETVDAISMKMSVDPKVTNPKASPDAVPVNISIQAQNAEIGVKLDGLKVRPVLDLWAFLVAHPTREALAGDEAKFKSLALAAIGSQLFLQEDGATPKMTVQSQPGVFGLEGVKAGMVLAAAGPASRYEQRIAVAKLALPDGLVPPMFHDLVPTAFDLAVKVTGFDANAAGAEAIADMHLAGTDPVISKADGEMVSAKLLGAGPVTIEISPSHVVAPQLDLAIEGRITYSKGKPTGTVTLHMRNFDKTVTAMKALGPDTEKQMLPVLTMAKGLAKSDPDGLLTWVGEVGADGIMKVNGLPLGKAPF